MNPASPAQQVVNACPACGVLADVTAHEPFTKVTCPSCGAHFRSRDKFDHFVLLEQIGIGGMSRVFRARDTSLERDVALKILNRACSQDITRARQFEKEAEITAQMSHPNVVRVFTAGRDQGYFYIAMELVSKGSLEAILRHRKKLKEAEVLEMAVQAVQGLRAANEAGLVHRDIKPGNILFAEDGTPKIVDFGLAIFAHDSDGSGEIWATPYYVPLETLNHEPEDFRSDIYSLGATLYHVLTGRPHCDRDSASLKELREIKSRPIHVKPSVRKLSEETCSILERAMAVKSEGRYRNYDEFLDHLKYAQRRLRRGGKGKPWPGRRRRSLSPWRWAGAAAAVVVAGLCLFFALRKEPAPVIKKGGGSLITDADPTAGSDSSTSARFIDARTAMLEANFGKAREIFEGLGDADGTRQPTRHWARFNAGLCALFMGDTVSARSSYRAITREGLYSAGADDADLAHFFVNTAEWLAADGTVQNARKEDCPADSVRAIGLLAAGLKNWHAGDAAAAADFLSAFDASVPPRSAEWVESCKALIKLHLAEATLIAALPAADVGKLSPEEAAKALSAARDTLSKLTLPSAAKEKAVVSVEAFAAAVAKQNDPVMATSGGNYTQLANSELKLIHETNVAAAALGEGYRFTEASARLKALNLTTKEATTVRDAHSDTWQKASHFLEQLMKDLAARTVEGAILRESDGIVLRAAISASGTMLSARPAQGAEIKIPVSKALPSLLVELAFDVRARVTDSDDFYRRSELIHAFALRTGLHGTADAAAEALVAEQARFGDQLSTLNTVEVVDASK